MTTETPDTERAQRLRALRGLKPQQVLARELDVSLRAYQRWEKGYRISWPNMKKLAALHGVSEEHILGYSEAATGPIARFEAKMDAVLRSQQKLEDELARALAALEVQDALGAVPDKNGALSPAERVGAAIRAEREERGLSQERLAQLAGVTAWTVSRLENAMAERPHKSTLAKLGTVLELHLD
jgi:transcriptional regulator with XRE-family HTH domain